MGLLTTLESLCQHPLNRSAPWAALWRFGRWQISQRVYPRRVVTPWVDGTRLVVGAGETGLTGNIYCGLHEFADMAFVLHYLRATDRFVDVGANAGSYTVLAAGAVGAKTISLEPVPATFERLLDNVNVNRLATRVDCLNCAAGAQDGELAFSAGSDTMNHVLAADESTARAIRVPVRRLDDVVPRDRPVFLKIDVEGFEAAVIAGARGLLGDVAGMLIEMNGSSQRYGGDDARLHEELVAAGLAPFTYAPFERRLETDTLRRSGNLLYLRDIEQARERVRSAPRARVFDTSI